MLALHFHHALATTHMAAHKATLTPEYAKTSSHETSGSISIESINLAAASILEFWVRLEWTDNSSVMWYFMISCSC
jgi:hypothetical protein